MGEKCQRAIATDRVAGRMISSSVPILICITNKLELATADRRRREMLIV
jgi:hypothetical protein